MSWSHQVPNSLHQNMGNAAGLQASLTQKCMILESFTFGSPNVYRLADRFLDWCL